MTTNCRIRFMENNFASLISSSIEYSSQLTGFPFSNAINPFRSLVWKPSGLFRISTTNNKLYINDGSAKTITLTSGDYSPSTLATHIQTQLNDSSSNWSCSYDSVGETYRFTISRTSSATLAFSQTTNSAWDDLGYVSTSDVTATSWEADLQRNHGPLGEYCIFDMGYNAQMTFFACISPLDEIFSISSSATIKLEANNLNDFSSSPFSVTLERTDKGIFKFLDNMDSSYRYWKFSFIDTDNPLGPSGFSIGHIYLGDYIALGRNISNGFNYTNVDPSDKSESESGTLYFDTRPKYDVFDGLSLGLMDIADKQTIEKAFRKLGITTPLYVSIDPLEKISNIEQFTKYCVFDSAPTFNQIIFNRFTANFKLRELI